MVLVHDIKGEEYMVLGKTIELYLVDGTYKGIVMAELSNWNAKAIKIARSEVSNCNRTELQLAGVYFLFCKDDDGTGKDSVYIGEADNIKDRLKQHISDFNADKEKYYWNTAVCFTGEALNKTLVRYLENRLYEITKEVGRYAILTKQTYSNTIIKESHKVAMEAFIENVKIVVNALGYKILEPVDDREDKKEYLYIKNKRNATAKGFASAEGFVVAKGSKISDDVTPSFHTDCYYRLRENLIATGIIEGQIFKVDHPFSSPSAASSVVIGNTTNGRLEWKTENGTALKDL